MSSAGVGDSAEPVWPTGGTAKNETKAVAVAAKLVVTQQKRRARKLYVGARSSSTVVCNPVRQKPRNTTRVEREPTPNGITIGSRHQPTRANAGSGVGRGRWPQAWMRYRAPESTEGVSRLDRLVLSGKL